VTGVQTCALPISMIKLIGVTGTPLVEIGRQMRESGDQAGGGS